MSSREQKQLVQKTTSIIRRTVDQTIIPEEKINPEEISDCRDIINAGINEILQNPAFREAEPHLRATMEIVDYVADVANARPGQSVDPQYEQAVKAADRSFAMLAPIYIQQGYTAEQMGKIYDDILDKRINKAIEYTQKTSEAGLSHLRQIESERWDRFGKCIKYFIFAIIILLGTLTARKTTKIVTVPINNLSNFLERMASGWQNTPIVGWTAHIVYQLVDTSRDITEASEDAVGFIAAVILFIGLMLVNIVLSANQFNILGLFSMSKKPRSKSPKKKTRSKSPKKSPSQIRRRTILTIEPKKPSQRSRSG